MTISNEQIQALHQQLSILRAMALNYAAGHHWDHLDGEAVTKAADGIDALLAERDADKKLIAELEESHKKLRETMAAIHNTIRADGAYTPLAAIMSGAKRAYEESAAVAGIKLEVGE